jgi:restriction endonuclease Mrr
LKKDRYGVVDDKAWTDEIARFMNKVVMTKLNAKQKAVLGNQIAVAAENGRKLEVRTNAFKIVNDLIEGPVCDRAAEIERETGFDDAMSPIDYEHFCATVLRRKGWKCEVTKASGDQGIDVLATKGGIRLALQCKMYSSPVGNAAVQEIVAAKVHVGATVAAVVATNGYTRSAHDLAHTTKTLLLHHGDLLRIEELVSA